MTYHVPAVLAAPPVVLPPPSNAAANILAVAEALQPGAVNKIESALKADPDVAAYSLRVKLGAMFSNFTENTSSRLNGVDPAAEDAAVPALRQRINDGDKTGPLLAPGKVLIPTLLARGMTVMAMGLWRSFTIVAVYVRPAKLGRSLLP